MSDRLSNRRILIVDDDADIRTSIDLAFRGEGARTEVVADGNAAVHAVMAERPDLVVLDMMLPKASGFVVLDKIKSMDDAPRVIMVTANEGKRHMTYAEAHGVDAYLYKPVPLQRLVDTAVQLLQDS
jgi:DNA-binding response OmpR family regulator